MDTSTLVRRSATCWDIPATGAMRVPARIFASEALVGAMAGTREAMDQSFGSACHGAGRSISRHEALRRFGGQGVVHELAGRGILVRRPSLRGVAEEAPGAYKDVHEVVEALQSARLARIVARLEPRVCIKG